MLGRVLLAAAGLAFSVALVCAGSGPALADYVIQQNTDYPGNDIGSFTVPGPARNTYPACMSACDASPECRAWTYVKPGVQGRDAVCWLKSTAGPPVASDCCISGVKVPPPGAAVQQRFENPRVIVRIAGERRRRHLDWCYGLGYGCGEQAADAYCRLRGFDHAKDYRMRPKVPYGTATIGTGQFCQPPFMTCDSFSHITCEGRRE